MSKKQFPPKEFAELIVALYEMRQGKPQDEFAIECLAAVQKIMPTATKMTREPFGFIFDENGKIYYSAVRAIGKKLTVETYALGMKENGKN